MSEEENEIIKSFWGENAPTRNILLTIFFMYFILTIISLALFPDENLVGLVKIITLKQGLLMIVAQYNVYVLKGFVYQLFTAIIVHVNILHLLSNCLFLLIYGLRAEERILDKHYYLIFLLSALAGNLLTLIVFPINTISCGASGGIYGLLGVDLVLAHEADKTKSLWAYLGTGVIFVLLSSGINVNTLAHSVGLAIGVILTKYVFKKRKKNE
ncbi:MAG: rhomboid family intramembrane serine protease [Candidatus Heimdallarchaeaceae archaeon]